MLIIAKKETNLEKVFKRFYEQMESEKKDIIRRIKEFAGAEPLSFGYNWVFGYTCMWAYDTIRFPDNYNPSNMILASKENGRIYYKPNGRIKAGIKFKFEWKRDFKGLDGNILTKFGIPVMDETTGIYCNWFPIHNKDDNFGIEVPSSLLDRMPKHVKRQFYIDA